MKRATQMMGRALLGALVLAWMATAGWSQSITWLGTLGGSESEAWDVSANGVVVGWSYDAAGQRRAFRWENGVMQELGTLGGDESRAYGVSTDGLVVVVGLRTPQGSGVSFAGSLVACKTSARCRTAGGA